MGIVEQVKETEKEKRNYEKNDTIVDRYLPFIVIRDIESNECAQKVHIIRNNRCIVLQI